MFVQHHQHHLDASLPPPTISMGCHVTTTTNHLDGLPRHRVTTNTVSVALPFSFFIYSPSLLTSFVHLRTLLRVPNHLHTYLSPFSHLQPLTSILTRYQPSLHTPNLLFASFNPYYLFFNIQHLFLTTHTHFCSFLLVFLVTIYFHSFSIPSTHL